MAINFFFCNKKYTCDIDIKIISIRFIHIKIITKYKINFKLPNTTFLYHILYIIKNIRILELKFLYFLFHLKFLS